MTDVADSIKLTDVPSLAIVASNQQTVGDKQPGRTLVRIIHAFHHAGLRLMPDAPGSGSDAVPSAASSRSGGAAGDALPAGSTST